jgi:hypothetical protein
MPMTSSSILTGSRSIPQSSLAHREITAPGSEPPCPPGIRRTINPRRHGGTDTD